MIDLFLKTVLPFIEKNWKLVLIGVLLALIGTLYVKVENETHKANEAEKGREAAITLSNGWHKMTTVYKNKYGDVVTRVNAIEVDKANIKALSESQNLTWLRKFEGLKKDNSNLQSASTFETTFKAEDVPETIKYLPCKDSLQSSAFDLHDDWNNIHALVIGKPIIEIKDRYYGVIELKRPKHWFWKFLWRRREPISEITNSNKLIKIDSISVIVIKH